MTTPRHSFMHWSVIEPLEARIAPATFTVLNLDDAGAGSLRDAVADANAAPGNDKILFQGGLAGKITLTTGEIPITDDLVIRGPATGAIKISGNDASRIFHINDGVAAESNVKLINLTLRDGAALAGGAVQSFDNLTLKNSLFRDNAATFSGGAVFLGVSNATLTVANTRFVANSAPFEGGALAVRGDLDVRSSSFTGNTSGGLGGAIEVFGFALNAKLVIVGTVFQDNEAANFGGAIHLDDVESAAIRNSTIIGNATTAALQDGGGIHLVNTFLNLTRTTIAGNTAAEDGGGLSVDAGSTAFLDACVVKGNEATGDDGGGIISSGTLVISGSRIAKNMAGDDGGGIRTEGPGKVTITKSLIKGNIAVDDGGGLSLISGANGLIDHCLITGNTAADSGGGLTMSSGTLTVIATTIANNSANIGGGVSLSGTVIARFTDSFITGNTAITSGGGIVETTTTAPVLQNTRVSGNTAPVDPQTSGTFLIG